MPRCPTEHLELYARLMAEAMTEAEVNEVQGNVTTNWARLLKADELKTVVL